MIYYVYVDANGEIYQTPSLKKVTLHTKRPTENMIAQMHNNSMGKVVGVKAVTLTLALEDALTNGGG